MKRNLIDENNEELSLATLQGEVEHVEAELVPDFDTYERQSLAVQKKTKEALESKRNAVMISLDNRKLSQAQKIFDGMENIQELFADPEIMKKVRLNTRTAMDLKFLSESYAKMLDSMQKLTRLDTVDGQGNPARLSLAVQLKSSNGTELSTVIRTEA